jgi:uncharacterized membrane protein YagU involved in acid resistance
MTGESIKSGLTAGFVASAFLGILMIIKSRLGILPGLDPIHDIVAIADRYTGLQFPPNLGWVGHFFIGTIVWGLVYVWLRKRLPGTPIVKGLIFGLLAWLAMMLVFMPLAGHGFFGLGIGWVAPAATLVLHLVYGTVLAAVYASTRSAAAIDDINPA